MTRPGAEEADRRHMARALELAARARGRTAPNPMVGAVVVSGGRVVGEGWHPRAGEPHAEVFALREAGEAARGATLYVTLEPCCHHGRTPPCAEAVVRAGIRRVVAATGDPFPRVSGGGFGRLREAGIEVECGLLAREALELNRAYFRAVRTGLPWLTLKMAVTLDGKIATRTGDSRWVTGEAAREQVHRLRDWHDAVLIGSGTARADNPQLTARLDGARSPLRVVIDARAELSPESLLARTAREVPTLLACGPEAETGPLERWGVEVVRLPLAAGRVPLEPLLRELVRRGIHSVLCEGGARLAGSLLDAGLVNELAWFIAPKLVGDREAPGAVEGAGITRMTEAPVLSDVRVSQFGPDLLVSGYLTPLDFSASDETAVDLAAER
ncbi:MAG: bifunctional diaminohydroxyphosphoribosylaminopyrimidine deaminase/5-amino-6-(5-phosphoribosylamino)uracil reductase RibD [Armatimonadota bacterium]